MGRNITIILRLCLVMKSVIITLGFSVGKNSVIIL